MLHRILILASITSTLHAFSTIHPERSCHDYYNTTINCHKFNITPSVFCDLCENIYREIYTICQTTEYEFTARDIINNLPVNTSHLIIIIQNKWQGYLPLNTHLIDLSPIGRLTNLNYLHITGEAHHLYQTSQIRLENVTELTRLTQLNTLRIRIPIDDVYYNYSSISKMIQHLPHLQTLDLSSTRGLGYHSVLDILRSLKKEKLYHLCLRQFQIAGGYKYVSDFKNIFNTLAAENVTFPNLVEIDLSDNAICRMPPFTSWLAPKLKILDISGNVLLDVTNIALLMESIMHRNIMLLNMGYQGSLNKYVKPFSDNTSETITGAPINQLNAKPPERIELELEYNQTKFILNCLQKVLSKNSKEKSYNISSLFFNDTQYGENLCHVIKCFFPLYTQQLNCSIQKFLMPVTNFLEIGCLFGLSFPFGENLQEVSLDNVHYEQAQNLFQGLSNRISGIFCGKSTNFQNETKIRKMELQDNSIWISALLPESSFAEQIKGVKGFGNLRTLNLGYNNIPLNGFSTLDSQFSGNLTNLRELRLSGNNLDIGVNITTSMCLLVPNAKYIFLDQCNISSVNFSIFHKCMNLEILDLRQNRISNQTSNLETFSQLQNLTYLYLQNNRINYLSTKAMQQISLHKKIQVNLLGNPLLCDCTPEAVVFIKWIVNNRQKFASFDDYSCRGLKGNELIKNIALTDFDSCTSKTYSLWTLIVSVSATIGGSLLIAAFISLYKIRWRLRYHIFKLQQAFKYMCCCLNRQQKVQHFFWKYDAFISYCSNDRFWVHPTLMKTLEEKYGFRLCIHYRDFPVGDDIAETIHRKMEQSREIIIVVSEIALSSGWCNFELDEALRQMNRRRTNLVVIKLGQLENSLLNTKLAHVLDTHTFLEWTNNTKRHKLFWAALVGRLYNDADGGGICCCPYGARQLGYQDIIDPQDDEDEASNNLSEEERQQKLLRLNLERAVQYKNMLQEMLDSEDRLPQWAFGPVPWPIEQVLKSKKEEMDDQMLDQATHRLKFLVKCLREVEWEHRTHSCGNQAAGEPVSD